MAITGRYVNVAAIDDHGCSTSTQFYTTDDPHVVRIRAEELLNAWACRHGHDPLYMHPLVTAVVYDPQRHPSEATLVYTIANRVITLRKEA